LSGGDGAAEDATDSRQGRVSDAEGGQAGPKDGTLKLRDGEAERPEVMII
jgi:hypothetical protein